MISTDSERLFESDEIYALRMSKAAARERILSQLAGKDADLSATECETSEKSLKGGQDRLVGELSGKPLCAVNIDESRILVGESSGRLSLLTLGDRDSATKKAVVTFTKGHQGGACVA